jgi:hypothetical protein
MRQHAVISPTSTTFLESYLLGVPLISLESLAGVSEVGRRISPTASRISGTCFAPTSDQEFFEIIEDDTAHVKQSQEIDKHLVNVHGVGQTKPPMLNLATDIMSLASQVCRPSRSYPALPTFSVDLIDAMLVRKWQRKTCGLHGNFNYLRGFHEVPK